jgi:hypothetical protein
MILSSSCYSSSCTFWSKKCICSTRHLRHTFLIFEQIDIFLSSARTVSSSLDFGVEQFFRADEFRADDPSPAKEKKLGNNTFQFFLSFAYKNAIEHQLRDRPVDFFHNPSNPPPIKQITYGPRATPLGVSTAVHP